MLDDLDLEKTDRAELTRRLTDDALGLYDERERELGDEIMRVLERYLLLQTIDQRWREHLYDMDYLREGIHLRGFAQIEPLVAYKNEAFELFRDLMNSIWGDFGRMIFHVEVTIEGDEQPEPPVARRPSSRSSSSTGGNRNVTYCGSSTATALGALAAGTGAGSATGYAEPPPPGDGGEGPRVEQRKVDAIDQIGRNDPCWCGSGKKFKKCHGTQ
jgi:preprotein translocase subunit SecA